MVGKPPVLIDSSLRGALSQTRRGYLIINPRTNIFCPGLPAKQLLGVLLLFLIDIEKHVQPSQRGWILASSSLVLPAETPSSSDCYANF